MAGEELGGSLYAACPGGGCPIWEAAAGDYEHKVETRVCDGCRRCGGNPPESDEGQAASDEPDAGNAAAPAEYGEAAEVEDLVDDIADIIAWEDAGFATDWSVYPFETKSLVRYWRSAETDIANIRAVRMQAYLKSKFKQD